MVVNLLFAGFRPANAKVPTAGATTMTHIWGISAVARACWGVRLPTAHGLHPARPFGRIGIGGLGAVSPGPFGGMIVGKDFSDLETEPDIG